MRLDEAGVVGGAVVILRFGIKSSLLTSYARLCACDPQEVVAASVL